MLGHGRMDAKTCKRERRVVKEALAKLMRGRRGRARCIRCSSVAEIIKQMLPKASHAAQWKLATQRTKAMAAAWMAGFEKLNLRFRRSLARFITSG